MKAGPCPVCSSPARLDETAGGAEVLCCRCGEFRITDLALTGLPQRLAAEGERGLAVLSGWLRENWGSTLQERDLERILRSRMPSVGERADRLLIYLAKAFPAAGSSMEIGWTGELERGELREEYLGRTATQHLALEAAGYCLSFRELKYLLADCLSQQNGYLEIQPGHDMPSRITPAGWARILELQQSRGSGSDGFIAMWFDASMDGAAEAIHQAIRAAGYNPVRLDRVEYNNQIDDEIIARIRGSRFLVADLTGHRGGVYFEAGFGLGLGLPVVWLCRESDLDNVHFDNRQYNFITWRPDQLAELERRLKHRIEATIGHGPVHGAGSAG